MKSNALKLSIVIPAYNEEGHLTNCLNSIKTQTVKPAEVIVVDNNSTDKTVEIARRFKFVKVLTESKQGVFYARNKGFNSAKHPIIGRIDADSILNDDWVENVLNIFQKSETQAATGPAHFYDMPLAPKNYIVDHVVKKPLYKFDKQFPFLFGTNMAIRKSAWDSIKPKVCDDKRIHEDIDLAIHLHKQQLKIVYSSKMKVGMSARRYDDKPVDFYKYLTMMKTSYAKHHMKPVGPHVAIVGFGLGYLMFGPLRRSYDPSSGKRTIRQFIAGHKARKNPNAT
jgi:glycosyltransferase involved in cell wall biosynthesis